MFLLTKLATSKYSKQHTPWLTSCILSIIKIKNKAKRKANLTHCADDIATYKKLKNQLKIYVHEAKLSYLQKL